MKNRVLGMAIAAAVLGMGVPQGAALQFSAAKAPAPIVGQTSRKKQRAQVEAMSGVRHSRGRKWPRRTTAQIKRDARKRRATKK